MSKKINIQIKSVLGAILFEYESKDNTIAKTMEKAISSSADLSSADLRSADLSSADLSYADLRSADLRYANLSYANLSYANLSYADLRSADLSSADLRSADLSYANLSSANLSYANLSYANLSYANLSYADLRSANRVIKIKKATVITGLYKYMVMPIIAEDGTEWVGMGCYLRTVKDWDEAFWNNVSEFPNVKSYDSQLRLMAFKTAKTWLKLTAKTTK